MYRISITLAHIFLEANTDIVKGSTQFSSQKVSQTGLMARHAPLKVDVTWVLVMQEYGL
jgi:hypothetical protein